MKAPRLTPLEAYIAEKAARPVALAPPPPPEEFHAGGATFDATLDAARLGAQMARVRDLMADGRWRTLREIAQATGAPEASVSARLRDLRKERHGSHVVEARRRKGAESKGLWEYRVPLPAAANDTGGQHG